nr:hypothetical protein [uncultured Lichenicoccus sp.]
MPDNVLVILRPDPDRMAARGLVLRAGTEDVARSRTATLVPADPPRLDLDSRAGRRSAVLAARSIACPGGGSGAFVSQILFRRVGVRDAVAGRVHEIRGEPVARTIADGEAAIGFQQVSEIGDVPGWIATASRHRDAAARLVRYLTTPPAQEAIAASGLGRVRP